jgi:dihydrofolate reductase
MSIVFTDISVSADGFAAAVGQSLEHPFGIAEGQAPDWMEHALHRWMFETPEENQEALDEITNAGAFIMGRNMFGPDRGELDPDWKGWWGDNPPYHGPVFVLSHYERPDVPMEGGTTWHFVTGGIHEALRRAREAAGDRNISITGGASTVNQYLAAELLDELRMHVSPAVVGAGSRLFDGVPPMELTQVSARAASLVTHIVYHPVR